MEPQDRSEFKPWVWISFLVVWMQQPSLSRQATIFGLTFCFYLLVSKSTKSLNFEENEDIDEDMINWIKNEVWIKSSFYSLVIIMSSFMLKWKFL